MLPGQMLPGQMSSWQLKSAKEVPRNLPLKFGQNRASNSWYMASFPMEIIVWGWTWTTTISFPVVDFAASSRSWGSVCKLGLQSNWKTCGVWAVPSSVQFLATHRFIDNNNGQVGAELCQAPVVEWVVGEWTKDFLSLSTPMTSSPI